MLVADFQYDAAGNMTYDAKAAQYYSYDQENRVTGAGGYTYTYDDDGNRVEKSNGTTGTLYWYMSPGIVAESDLSGNLTAEYVFFDGERVARKDLPGGAVSYYFSDHLKTTDIVTDAQGNIKNESDFYPWGGELQFLANDSNHYKFTGKERDAETQLDYFGARYYSNGLGRFITPDWSTVPVPVPYADLTDPQSLNQYSYVRNIPTVRADADGHDGLADVEVIYDKLATLVDEGTAEGAEMIASGGGRAILGRLLGPVVGTAIIVKELAFPSHTVGQSDAEERAQIEQAKQERMRQNGGVDPQSAPTTPNAQPKPQTPPAPQAAAEHDKNKRRSTKDKHEKRRPGTSAPPNYKPDRNYVQPKDDKKKDKEKPPYHRKDRDKKQGGYQGA
jgi:RHS repeat-associated protein